MIAKGTPFTCPHCPLSFVTSKARNVHAKAHISQVQQDHGHKYVCTNTNCCKTFTTRFSLKRHAVRARHGLDDDAAAKVWPTNSSRSDVDVEEPKTDKDRAIFTTSHGPTLDTRDKASPPSPYLASASVAKQSEADRDLCAGVLKKDTPIHVPVSKLAPAPPKRFMCGYCLKPILLKNRGAHVLKHKKILEGFCYTCTSCSATFTTVKARNVHAQIHRPYACPQCSHTFATADFLERHKSMKHHSDANASPAEDRKVGGDK
jgi:DNA-directed RNA polymerase subunit RPC12/RpoP